MSLMIDNLHLDIKYHHNRPRKAAEFEQQLQSMVLASLDKLMFANVGDSLSLPDIHVNFPQINADQFMLDPQYYFNQYVFPKITQVFNMAMDRAYREQSGDVTKNVVTKTGSLSTWSEIKSGLVYSRGALFDCHASQPKQQLFTLLLQCLQLEPGYRCLIQSWLLLPVARLNLIKLLMHQEGVIQVGTLLQLLFPKINSEQYLPYIQSPNLAVATQKSMWQNYLFGLLNIAQGADENKPKQLLLMLQSYHLVFITAGSLELNSGKQSQQSRHHFSQLMMQLRDRLTKVVEKPWLNALTTWVSLVQYQGVKDIDIHGLERLLNTGLSVYIPSVKPKMGNFACLINALTALHHKLNQLVAFTGTEQQLQVKLRALVLWLQQVQGLPIEIVDKTHKQLNLLATYHSSNRSRIDVAQLSEKFDAVLSKSFAANKIELCQIIEQILQVASLPLSLYQRLDQSLNEILDGKVKKLAVLCRHPLGVVLCADINKWCSLVNQLTNNRGHVGMLDGTVSGGLSRETLGHWQAIISELMLADFTGPDICLSVTERAQLQPMLAALMMFNVQLPADSQQLVKDFLQQYDRVSLNKLHTQLFLLVPESALINEVKRTGDAQNAVLLKSSEQSSFDSLYRIERDVLTKVKGALSRLLHSLDDEHYFYPLLSLFLIHLEQGNTKKIKNLMLGHHLYQELAKLWMLIDDNRWGKAADILFWHEFKACIEEQLSMLTRIDDGLHVDIMSWWGPLVMAVPEPVISGNKIVAKHSVTQSISSLIEAGDSQDIGSYSFDKSVFITLQANLLATILALPIAKVQDNPADILAMTAWCEQCISVLADIKGKPNDSENIEPDVMIRQQVLLGLLEQTKNGLQRVNRLADNHITAEIALVGHLVADVSELNELRQLDLVEVLLNEDNEQYIEQQLRPMAPYHQAIALSLDKLASSKLNTAKVLHIAKIDTLVTEVVDKISAIKQWQSEQYQQLLSLDAGLLLLWPYLNTFFNQFSLLQTSEAGITEFVDQRAQAKAHALLVCLLSKPVTENVYVVANLLVGFEPETLAETEIKLNQDDNLICEHFLTVIINHWQALKGMPVASFREMFLLRTVNCAISELGYNLSVENKAQDVLMTKLPWGLGIISLPWLGKQLLQVEWQHGC